MAEAAPVVAPKPRWEKKLGPVKFYRIYDTNKRPLITSAGIRGVLFQRWVDVSIAWTEKV